MTDDPLSLTGRWLSEYESTARGTLKYRDAALHAAIPYAVYLRRR